MCVWLIQNKPHHSYLMTVAYLYATLSGDDGLAFVSTTSGGRPCFGMRESYSISGPWVFPEGIHTCTLASKCGERYGYCHVCSNDDAQQVDQAKDIDGDELWQIRHVCCVSLNNLN